MQDHVANDGVRKSVAEVTPFNPGVLTLIHAVVGCGKNPRVVLRVDDDGVDWNVGQIAGAIAPAVATVCRSEDVTSSKGRATCPYNLFRSSKDNNITDEFVSRTRQLRDVGLSPSRASAIERHQLELLAERAALRIDVVDDVLHLLQVGVADLGERS